MFEVKFYNKSNKKYFYSLYKASEIPDKKQRKKRRGACGKCEFCMKDDCGTCKNGRDMRKFGGQGKKSRNVSKENANS